MGKKTKKYKIETPKDFLKIPDDRLDDFWSEFKEFIKLAKNVDRASDLASEILGVEGPEFQILNFTWIDDGEKKKTVNFGFAKKGGAE